MIAGGVVLLWALWTLAPWVRRGSSTNHTEIKGESITSIQEIDCANPPQNIAELYFRRLRRLGGFLLWQTYHSETRSTVRFLFVPLIRFGAVRREPDRETLTIAHSLFSRHGGTLAFVRHAGMVRVELRGFRPRLVLVIYRFTQLPVHAASGRAFLAWLKRRSG